MIRIAPQYARVLEQSGKCTYDTVVQPQPSSLLDYSKSLSSPYFGKFVWTSGDHKTRAYRYTGIRLGEVVQTPVGTATVESLEPRHERGQWYFRHVLSLCSRDGAECVIDSIDDDLARNLTEPLTRKIEALKRDMSHAAQRERKLELERDNAIKIQDELVVKLDRAQDEMRRLMEGIILHVMAEAAQRNIELSKPENGDDDNDLY